MTRIIYNKDRKKLAIKAVRIISDYINKSSKDKIVLGIPGGRSVKDLFELFKSTDKIQWQKVRIFWIDERLVPTGSPELNYKLAHKSFIYKLIKENKLPVQNIHPFKLIEALPDKGSRVYTQELKKFGKFDIIILGIGEDCHVGALYPNHHSIKNETKEYFIMGDSPKPPKKRITASRNMIEKADIAVVLFLGEEKREAYRKYLSKGLGIVECPVKLIDSISNSYILTDLKL